MSLDTLVDDLVSGYDPHLFWANRSPNSKQILHLRELIVTESSSTTGQDELYYTPPFISAVMSCELGILKRAQM